MVGRKGCKKALLIVGHKILCAIYHILKDQVAYLGFDAEEFEKARKAKRIAYLQKELKLLDVA